MKFRWYPILDRGERSLLSTYVTWRYFLQTKLNYVYPPPPTPLQWCTQVRLIQQLQSNYVSFLNLLSTCMSRWTYLALMALYFTFIRKRYLITSLTFYLISYCHRNCVIIIWMKTIFSINNEFSTLTHFKRVFWVCFISIMKLFLWTSLVWLGPWLGIEPGTSAFEASTIPLGYRGGITK